MISDPVLADELRKTKKYGIFPTIFIYHFPKREARRSSLSFSIEYLMSDTDDMNQIIRGLFNSLSNIDGTTLKICDKVVPFDIRSIHLTTVKSKDYKPMLSIEYKVGLVSGHLGTYTDIQCQKPFTPFLSGAK